MSIFEVLAFLFSGVGGSLIVAWLFHRMRYTSHQVGGTRITTPRSAPPTVYQPVYTSPSPAPAPSMPPTPPATLPEMSTVLDSGSTFWNPDSSVPETEVVTLQPGELYRQWQVPADGNKGVYYEPQVNFGVDPTIHFPQDEVLASYKPAPVADYVSGNLNFDPKLTKLVGFDDDSISVVGNDRFIYADKEEGVLLASKYDADKWEEVEFKKTEKEISYRLRKK